ncbi:unnamed protein product [Parnassius apollo]|uniref:(apollo) hypothetical protein n=1 Tax=Parnassius apollo TaxID=110799 RepID=A0A8S3WDD9_PARAO|nr:unnamed protein product [Parnassius apollo]
MSARVRPPVPGRFSNHVDSGGSRDGAVSWGAYNLRARKISRQTTQARSMDTDDTLSDSDSLYTPGNDRQKSIPNISHQSLSSSLSSSSQLLKDDAQKITPVI